jgi:hypothetical protein
MRRLHSRNRIARCRRQFLTHYSEQAQTVGESCKTDRPLTESEIAFAANVPAEQRAYVLAHGGFCCATCGIAPGDVDDLTGVAARFHIESSSDKRIGANQGLSGIRALCSTCDEGLKSIESKKPTWVWLLSQIRRAGEDEQLVALEWLRSRFSV